ncbi:MAG: aminotransferase class I/II-fold pyridoxal phosphate-dependent enzyme [Planctomycetota bacterium]|nr:aminotransferase class I/II-fold pyridoxal phosphate-dependent enzyme [Planctomycetota bacterium]
MEIAPANRLQKLPPYLFAALRQKIAAKRAEGKKIISLGIGDPDQPTPDPVVQRLIQAVNDPNDPNRHRYGCDVPVPEFAAEARRFYQRRYGVDLAEDEVITTSGSKDAIVQLCLGLLNPGDLGIAPMPGYPTYNIGHVFASACTYYAPLLPQNRFLVDFDAIPQEARRLAKILWLNYPNNPTTAVADLEFFSRAVEFGRKHDILIAHDNAYGENVYDGQRPISILQVPGAKEVAVELFSLSKAFNMTGWRAGVVVGNASAIKALRLVKENSDNGTLRAIQFAAARALAEAETLLPRINAVYQRRRDLVCAALAAAGWPVEKPRATIYVWAPVPEKYQRSSAAFAEDLLEKANVVVTPGLGYGQWGEGFYRISLTYPDEVLEEALARIRALAQ